MNFITIDFETANSNNNSACSMGLVHVKDKKIVDTKYYLLQPPNMAFDKKNIEIHGITPEMVQDCPKFNVVWEEIKNYFSNNIILAHNAQFDMSILKCLQLEYDLDVPNFKYLCSIAISSIASPEVGNSLSSKAEYFGIDMGAHHNAMDDAVTCAKIVLESIKKGKLESITSFIDSYALPVKNFYDLNYQKNFSKSKKRKYSKIDISEILPDEDLIDYSHAFYGKNVVFTGELSKLDRKEAMQIIVNLGGIIKSGVSRTTNYLVVGTQDKSIVGDDGLSTKEEKAYGLIAQGFNIQIITEEEFYNLIAEKSF